MPFRRKERSFSTGQRIKTSEDENYKEKLNNELEDMKYLNYTKQRDSFENQKSIIYFKIYIKVANKFVKTRPRAIKVG